MQGIKYTAEGLNLEVYESYLSPQDAQNLFNYLEEAVAWPQKGKAKDKRRLNQNYGDEGLGYTLKLKNLTIDRKVKPWDDIPILKTIRDDLAERTHHNYNICVIQRYPDGKIGIAPHRDKETGPGKIITGLSLGSTRKIVFRPPRYLSNDPVEVLLPPGSLYLMKPPTNDYWTHSIDPDPSVTTPRISLTFRAY